MTASNIPVWTTGPRDVRLVDARLDVWRIACASSPTDVRRGAHLAMHDILARYLRIETSELRIARTPGGKPFLDHVDAQLSFNVSHCSDLALLAVHDGNEVGIDVERSRAVRHALQIARRVFDRDDLEALQVIDGDSRSCCFVDLWTQLEARQKAFGKGIFSKQVDRSLLKCYQFRPTPGHQACVCTMPADREVTRRFFDYSR